MKLIFLGPPGVGKGTQAKHICDHYDIVHLSTGDILREEIKNASEVGLAAKSYIDKGALVPDNVLLDLIDVRLGKRDVQNGYLLDGFPRTIPQAEALESFTDVSTVISIEVPDEDIVNRIVGRRMDPETGEIYHVSFKPSPPEIAHRLIQRKDDNEETVRMRLSAYHEQTKPLGDWYMEKGILHAVEGTGAIEEVAKSISKILINH